DCDLIGGPVQASLVGELESDAPVAQPADRAFDGSMLTKVKIDAVPKHRAERAANHCAAARQIDQLDVIILTFVRDFCTLADQAMAVLDAAVRPASRFAAD